MIEVQKQSDLNHLLGLLAEEGCEIGIEVSKAKRFGLYEQYTPEHPTNIERVINEVKDVVSIALFIQESYGIDFGVGILDKEHFAKKREKVIFYEDLSRKFGLLED